MFNSSTDSYSTTSFLRNSSADASENELEFDDKASSIDTEPDELSHSNRSMIDEDDEEVQMAITALSVMKTGGPSRATFDFCPPTTHQSTGSIHHHHHHHQLNHSVNDDDPGTTPSSDHHHQLHSNHRYSDSPIGLQDSHERQSHSFTALPTTSSSARDTSIALSSNPSRSAASQSAQPLHHAPPGGFYLDAEGEPVDAHGHPVDVIQLEDPEGGIFLQRVGRMPLVSGVVRAYERGKGTSRVVKYGADLVESSVTSLSGRVASTVGPERIAQIDRYAGAALDRLGQISGIPPPTTSHRGSQPSTSDTHYSDDGREASSVQYDQDRSGVRRRNLTITPSNINSTMYGDGDIHMDHGAPSSPTDIPQHRNVHEHNRITDESDLDTPAASPGGRLVQVANTGRSRWQSMLVEAGMTAGGIGAAVSEESMKSLKYCLHWLQYASAHMDHQITVLRDFIASLNVSGSSSDALISPSAVRTLANIKKEIVETIRKVVDVVSKYAGGALPEQAKQFVRKTILSLPIKWASTIQAENSLNPRKILAQAATTSQSGSDNGQHLQADRNIASTSQGSHTIRGTTEIAADRILSFAVEGLDMLKSVTGTFSESVDRADAWVERLRVIGIQHRQQRASNVNEDQADHHQPSSVDHPRPISRPPRGREKQSVMNDPKRAGSDSTMTGMTEDLILSRDHGFHRSSVRSRDSSASTCGATSTSSHVSGEDHSACSVNTSNTTITTNTSDSNRERAFPDRGLVKRRKANRGLPTTYASNPVDSLDIQSIQPIRENTNQIRSTGNSSLSSSLNPSEMKEGIERSTSTLKHLLNDDDLNGHEEWNGWGDDQRAS
ncbi:transcription factor Opi1-domain-containing protein [Melampsora americana]|nr:transcription factor Opi1-domain-containing protein [Melampsora americana]